MRTRRESAVLRVIRNIADKQREHQASDRDLLLRFVEKADEGAFTALVRRHGSMVMGVGLRGLRHYQDAEDVCQATFLLLAKKARTVAWRDSVANWLHRVAYHLSLTARRAARRRDAQESNIQPKTPPDVLAEITARDLQNILDEELDRLTKNYRTPLVLCCLEGRTRDEAARFLGVPVSTLKSRLEKGRELLRRRLAGRAVPLSLALGGVTLLSETVRAAVPVTVARAVSQAALQASAGKAITDVVSANVLALVKGGMQTMLLTKLKVTLAGLLLAGLLVSGLAIAGLGALPDSSQAQQPAAQNKDKARGKEPARKNPGYLKLRAKLEGHGKGVTCVAFSPNGKLLASGSDDHSIVIWNTDTGKQVATLTGDEEVIRSVAFSPDGKSLASVSHSSERQVRIWDVATWKEKIELKDNKGGYDYLSRCAFSPNGKVLAASFADSVKLWDTATGKKIGTIKEEQLITALVFSLDSKVLVLGVRYGNKFEAPEGEDMIRLWDWAEQKPKGTLKTNLICSDLHFTRDGKTLVSLGFGSALSFWDFEKSKERRKLGGFRGNRFALFAGGARVAVAWIYPEKGEKKGEQTWKTQVDVRDTETGELLESITLDASGLGMAVSRDGAMLAVGGAEKRREEADTGAIVSAGTGVVRIWDLSNPMRKLRK